MSKAYLYDLTDTWNAGATTFTAIKMNVTDTASSASSLLMDLQVGGSSRLSVRKDGRFTAASFIISSSGGFWSASDNGGFSLGTAQDLFLYRDAANTLAQRNGTSAQAFRVYNTYTDASNYELGHLDWVGNALYVRTTAAGTGTARGLNLQAAGNLFLGSGGSSRWLVSSSTGHFLANADNTYDIGASGANRPRRLYLADFAVINGALYLGASSTNIVAVADGVLRLQNGAGTDFGRLQFGGTTSSFPSIKRNGAQLDFRLADDSGDASIACNSVVGSGFVQGTRLRIVDGVSAPAAATGYAQIYVDTNDGDLKIIFADGTIKTIVTDT